MKNAMKILLSVVTALVAARTLLVGIDYLYKKYGRHYVSAND